MLQMDSCFFTNGFSFQKIAGFAVLIMLSRLSLLFPFSLILSKRWTLLLKVLNNNIWLIVLMYNSEVIFLYCEMLPHKHSFIKISDL